MIKFRGRGSQGSLLRQAGRRSGNDVETPARLAQNDARAFELDLENNLPHPVGVGYYLQV